MSAQGNSGTSYMNRGGYGSLPSSTWNNRQDLSIGGSDPNANMRYAGENLPGAPYWLQRQAAGYYGAPFISTNGISDYGRWNWGSPMSSQGSPQVPPPTPSPTPTPTPAPQPGSPAPTTGVGPGGFGGTPTGPQPGSPAQTVTYSVPGGQRAAGTLDGSRANRSAWWAAVANAAGGQGQDLPYWLTSGLTRTNTGG